MKEAPYGAPFFMPKFDSGYIKAMIVIGAILLVVGLVTGISVLWIIGAVLLVIGAVLALRGGVYHRPVGGRTWYW